MADLATTIAGLGGGSAVMRTGIVKSYDVGSITVDVGGGQLVSMPYLDGYLPIVGDPVQCLGQGGVWFALGRASQFPPDNTVTDPSFELTPLGSPPAAWGVYNDPGGGGGTLLVQTTRVPIGFEIEGTQMLEVSCQDDGLSIQTYVYSNPIPVTPGESWTAAASVFSFYQGIAPTMTLMLAFFSNAVNVYPTTAAPDAIISVAESPSPSPWMLMRGASGGTGVVVPAGVTHMRVVLKSVVFNIASALWEKVVCRRVS